MLLYKYKGIAKSCVLYYQEIDITNKGGIKMYIPTIVIICMICGGIGGTLGYYLTKKNKKRKK